MPIDQERGRKKGGDTQNLENILSAKSWTDSREQEIKSLDSIQGTNIQEWDRQDRYRVWKVMIYKNDRR